MKYYKGQLAEILLEVYQNASARLACPVEAAPRPGQYLQVVAPQDELQALPLSLYAAGGVSLQDGGGAVPLLVSGELPETWHPGIELILRGPLGRGFTLPKRAKRVALIALADGPGRLLPLAARALNQGAEVVLCSGEGAWELPLAVETRPLDEVAGLVNWADYIAVDIRLEDLEHLGDRLKSRVPRSVSSEVLVLTPMPCGGLAQCGVCALTTTKGPRLACEDGPVFELSQLLD